MLSKVQRSPVYHMDHASALLSNKPHHRGYEGRLRDQLPGQSQTLCSLKKTKMDLTSCAKDGQNFTFRKSS